MFSLNMNIYFTLIYQVYDDFLIGPSKEFTLHVGHSNGTAGKRWTDNKSLCVGHKAPISPLVEINILKHNVNNG